VRYLIVAMLCVLVAGCGPSKEEIEIETARKRSQEVQRLTEAYENAAINTDKLKHKLALSKYTKNELLSLSHFDLAELPEDTFDDLEHVKYLDLSNNQLTSIPSSIKKLENILELSINQCLLKEIPESLFKLTTLKELSIVDNKIENISGNINQLNQLETLRLSGNNLTTLPDMSGLTQLKSLSLNFNKFVNAPKTLASLPNIQALELNHNDSLISLPKEIGDLDKLKVLSIQGSALQEAPEEMGKLKNLLYLNLWKNKLTSLPRSIANLPQLKEKIRRTSVPVDIYNSNDYRRYGWMSDSNGINIEMNNIESLDSAFCNVSQILLEDNPLTPMQFKKQCENKND
jgi:Leucine-rich repeat (LRR) protein